MITTRTVFDIGAAFNGVVHACAFRPDGYLYVAGEFTTYKGVAANGICRIKPSGSLDTTFNAGVGFVSSATYYPPSQLLPTSDGGVVCVLAKTHTKLIVGGRVFTKMRFNGADVAPIIKLTRTGILDTVSQFDCVDGDTIAAATLVRDMKLCYIVVANPTLVKMIRMTNLEEYQVSCAMAGAWTDVRWTGSEDGRIVLVGPTLSAQVLRVEPVADTFTTAEWPLGLMVQMTDESLEPDAAWVAAVGAGGDKTAWAAMYSELEKRLYVGQTLEVAGVFGQWNDSGAQTNRGMYGIGLTGYSEWDLNNTGFEPYQDATDDDGYTIAAIPLAVHGSDGRVFAVAPFGTFRGVSVDRHHLVAVKRIGTHDSAFTCPTLTNSGGATGRVTCAAVAPSGDAVFIGGRFNLLAAATCGHAVMLNATTGAKSNALQVVDELQLIAYKGGGVRGVVWTGFGEGLYVAKPDK